MVNNHTKTFFGEKTALTVQSISKEDLFIFIKIFKKKKEGLWEKPSLGEGRIIKCSLEEIVSILQVIRYKTNEWSNYRIFKNKKTQFSFQWVLNNQLEIKIEDYSIRLKFEQKEILKMLLEHLLEEKIIYATVTNEIIDRTPLAKNNEAKSKSEDENKAEIKGLFKGETDKAILVKFKGGQEVWIPKSAIHSKYITKIGKDQLYTIENWILEKNKILD